jgi:hypothetical protein
MKITKLGHTCLASPSQWEGEFEDGTPVYIRYRWGYLSVSQGVSGRELLGKQVGDTLDGYIDLADVLKIAGLTVTEPVEEAWDE